MTETLTLTVPDDWHIHLRDGEILAETVAATTRCFRRAIVMPNLAPPITSADMLRDYRQRILDARPENSDFEPLMTLYLTDDTTAETIYEAKAAGAVAVKIYPAGATTHSLAGVGEWQHLETAFEAMQETGLLLLIHGEVTDDDIDIFDREKVFIDRHLRDIADNFPQLKIVFEHITTREAVEFVQSAGDNVAATITPQHLLLNRNDLLVGGIRPHNYCLPVLKRNSHQVALQKAAVSGSPKFFLGSDSAPHEQSRKESACGCAGCYTARSTIELYAQIFEDLGALDKLEAFASHRGADFYGLPRNQGTITLVKQPWQVPENILLPNGDSIIPFFAGQTLSWQRLD
ncbi:MAG: dihydroorotase [Cellvibrionaceae bacterium]|jgi:dihydroorotase